MELCTPCAGTRPGAADPTAQQSCVPATAPRTKVTTRVLVVFRRFWRSILRVFGMVLCDLKRI